MRRIVLWILGIGGVGAVGLVLAWVYVVQNVETPKYDVLRSDGPIELRAYPPLLAAEVTREGARGEAVRAGFRPLANYIFAREREGDTIAMTAPVTQARAAPEGPWAVQFIMPSDYDRDSLPAPAGQDVAIVEIPAREMAAIRFSGVAEDMMIARQEETLRAWLDAEGILPAGPSVYAYYNDPFTPGFLRRNEVLIPVAR